MQVDIGSKITENELLLLEREINLHAGVDHPHIIKLWDTLVEHDIAYMVMELAENGTLFSYQNKHRTINEAETFKFFSQTFSAIKYLHSHDIMHRDIKVCQTILSQKISSSTTPATSKSVTSAGPPTTYT